MFTYLLINLCSIAFPLVFSRSEKFGFGLRWKQAWVAVLLSAIPFILWDIVFTHLGVWSFNPKYVMGPKIFNLPVEEVLFFFAIPFACLFIYQQFSRKAWIRVTRSKSRIIWGLISLVFLMMALAFLDKIYTLSVGLLGAIATGLLAWTRPRYSRSLMLALLVQYFPFLIVNGILTYLPVVIYNPEAFMGFRIGSIPAEDAVYACIMLVLPVTIYEALGRRKVK